MRKLDHGLKGRVFSGLIWTFGEQFSSQAISFILSVILARLLMPEEYGTITMVLVFINIANVFVTNGFGEALIQKKNATEDDFSTIFFCSISVAILLYFLLFIAAPHIASFYQDTDLTAVLRVLSFKLPIAGINTVQRAYVQKHMQFKKIFFSTLGGTLFSGLLGIIMAYNGCGVWALVAQYMASSCIATIVMFFTIAWRPKLIFRKESAIELFKYAWKLTAASFINTIYNELRSLIIGRKYSTADLAYYNRGNHIPSLAITNINSSISTVMFPAMAQTNDNRQKLKSISRRSMTVTAYIIFPIMAGLIGIGRPLVKLLLTEKWMPCVPYLYMACLYWSCQPVQTTNWQIIKAVGRSDLALRLEIYKKIIGFTLIFISMPFGVKAMAASNVLFAVISMMINILPNKKLIGYTFWEQFTDLAPSFLSSVIMCVTVLGIGYLPLPDILLIFLQVITGIILYLICSFVFKIDNFYYVINILRNMKKG